MIGDSVTEEILLFIQFTSHMLYLFIAFMCGIIIGYIVGKIEGGM
jgi:hypothetical protein